MGEGRYCLFARVGQIIEIDYKSYEVPRSLFEYRVTIVFTFYYNDCYIHM